MWLWANTFGRIPRNSSSLSRGKGLYPKEGGNEEEVKSLRAEQTGLPQAGDEARPSEGAAGTSRSRWFKSSEPHTPHGYVRQRIRHPPSPSNAASTRSPPKPPKTVNHSERQ